MPPEGDLGLVSTSDPVLSNGTGESVEVAAGPQARGGGVGNAPGANAGPIAFAESRSALRTTKRLRRPIVGRLLDTSDKDLRGVSALQQSCARSAVFALSSPQRKCSKGMGGDFADSDQAVSAPLVSLAWVSQHESAAAEALGFWTSRTVTLLRV
jgi:hypothetical protein